MKNKNKCITHYCRRLKSKNRNYCACCRHRRIKEADPVRYTFYSLMSNARRRGKFFDLTLAQFRGFVSGNDYMKLKGRTKKSLSIDRIDNDKGYILSNIRAVSLSYNSRKSYLPNFNDFSEVPF